jgi:DNA-binding IclR family transcriptional regulator
MPQASRQAVKSANRVLDLFELLGRWGDEMSHTEIANALTIPKSSLSQLLPNLVTRGYLEFSSATKGYRLGAKLTALANQMNDGKRLEIIAAPVLQSLRRRLGE